MNIEQYIQEQTGLSTRQIAEKSGLTQSRLSRQFNGNTALTLDTLKDIALGTGLDFLDLAVKANLLKQNYVDRLRSKGALLKATDEELVAEVLRRMRSNAPIDKNAPFATQPFATHEEMARAELAEELKKSDVDIAAYRETDGDEIDYDSYN
ncbi:helix-turn-helix domain-containing protein [Rothia sp. CCM 9417]|uniref:helix-turn-helix domain-containing protein n=1 Tax=Rothia sp. CCM 9417 TaxID=3402657 RepID=UPI003ADD448C